MDNIEVFLRLFSSQSVAGRVIKRQTTYWDIQLLTGTENLLWRVSFSKKAERQVPNSTFTSVLFTNMHPILTNYQENWSWIHISKPHPNPRKIIEGIEFLVSKQTLGYRSANEYLNNVAMDVLSIGYGLLITAPDSIISKVASYLQIEAIIFTVLACNRIQHPEQLALLLGDGYIIAPKIDANEIS
jgi:hypothetical protein